MKRSKSVICTIMLMFMISACAGRTSNDIAFDPYTHGYYKVGGRVGEAFKDGAKLKNSECI